MTHKIKEYIALMSVLTTLFSLAIIWVYDGENLTSDIKGKICFCYLFLIIIPVTFSYWVLNDKP